MLRIINILCVTFFFNVMYAQINTKISEDQLPESIKTTLNNKFKKYKVNWILQLEDSNNNKSIELELQKKKSLLYLLYDFNGTLIQKNRRRLVSDKPKPVNKTPAKTYGGHNHSH